jgi:hypothetical protein
LGDEKEDASCSVEILTPTAESVEPRIVLLV